MLFEPSKYAYVCTQSIDFNNNNKKLKVEQDLWFQTLSIFIFALGHSFDVCVYFNFAYYKLESEEEKKTLGTRNHVIFDEWLNEALFEYIN